MKIINVSYIPYITLSDFLLFINTLQTSKLSISFDIETRSVFDKEERKEAKELIDSKSLDGKELSYAKLVSNSNGLSHPELVRVTHFIIGVANDESRIFIANTKAEETAVFEALSEISNKLLIHNALFDLKVMYNRIGKLPKNYVDTQLMAKSLMSNSDVWKSKTGLKDLMSYYYDPKWSLYNDYEPESLSDSKFLDYCAIDGAATFKLHELLMEEVNA